MDKVYCESCSMPMTKKEDFGGGDMESKYCVHCTDSNGKLKTYEDVFNGMVAFAVKNLDISLEAAQQEVANNMAKLPAWENHKN